MTILYRHEAPKTDCYDTRRIVVEQIYDGSTDITTIVGECGNPAAFMNHNLSIAESDKLGAVLCKDIIDNYKGHATDLKDRIAELENIMTDMQYDNIELQHENAELVRTTLGHNKVHASIVAGMQLQLADLRDIVHERNHFINKTVVEHNDHTHQLYARIEYLEAVNGGLKSDIETLRMVNTLYQKRWDERELPKDLSTLKPI